MQLFDIHAQDRAWGYYMGYQTLLAAIWLQKGITVLNTCSGFFFKQNYDK